MDTIKICIFKTIRLFMRLFCIIPLRKNRILFESYKGRSYSCNPKYIFEHLINHYSGFFETIWVFEEPDKWIVDECIKKVKKKSFLNFYYHMTSKIIITNMTDDVFLPKRKKQIVINTWHGGGAYKKVGLSYGNTQSKLTEWQDKIVRYETSYYISSSKLFTKYNIEEAYHFMGDILNVGLPRNDLFFSNERMEKVERKLVDQLKIEGKEVILYAPTFRGDFGDGKDIGFKFPYLDVIKSYEDKAREVVILNRSHYSIRTYNNFSDSSIIDVSNYDMQELLVIADILVTDFSSSIWDFSLMGKPCILYVPDIDEYLKERGTYTPIEKWPGIVATTESELIHELMNPDIVYCRKKAKESLEYYGSYEHGNAAKKTCEIIWKECLA